MEDASIAQKVFRNAFGVFWCSFLLPVSWPLGGMATTFGNVSDLYAFEPGAYDRTLLDFISGTIVVEQV